MDFETELREMRLRYGVSQTKLSTLSGYSREHINRVEQGKEVPSEKMKASLIKCLEKMNPENDFELVFDYVRLRFESHDVRHICEDILRIKMKFMLYDDFAFYGYIAKYWFSEIQVMISPEEDERGILIELKGQGCREFGSLLRAQKRSWFDFFRDCEKEKVHYKRIDLAINDQVGVIPISYLAEKCKKGELRSKFRSFRFLRSGNFEEDQEDTSLGETLYLGSLKSEIYFCFYQKNYEQMVKRNISLENSTFKNRYEIRLKNERAYYAIQDLLTYGDYERTIFGIINTYIIFLKPIKNNPKKSWQIDPMWNQFLGTTREKLKLTSEPQPYDITRTMAWLKKQVAPTLKMLLLIDQENGTKKIMELISATELSPQQIKKLESHT
ncbi:replication initiation factor domain-containing protein [Enterococcus raffinosus]|uniref:replication initiation factor domain-containing protein n=1 Tax=Enterococcus raffinosus TaxID=71452 RepID=UPI000E236368|nr:replication initiation factor domain-containing protein [Enterococcus raffinosus]MBU5362033.1 replication initiation factor domain-containing protein [Enterococcus raffinosus]REC32566.1 Cro/Cl family transcriptional regulator [Enterococcus pseudoavium]